MLIRWFTRRRLAEAALILAVIVAAQLYQNHGLADGPAPPLAGLRNDGVPIDLASQLGPSAAPILVVFWSTWCPVCQAEEGNISAVAEDWPVLSVAMQSGDAAAVSKHLLERGIRLPALVDASGRKALDWKVRGVPTHFVVDAQGQIRFRVVGYATRLGLRARLWWAQHVPA